MIVLVGMFVYAGAELILTRPNDRVARADWLHRFCARAIRRFGIRIDVIGQPPENGVLISNHTSYMDIVTYAALHRCVFCSKAEIRNWPVVGWMTTMAGTVYVERGRGGSAIKAAKGMQEASAAGLPVVFFPEGTTSNGEGLLKFHSGLLAQAMASEEPIVPAFIRYYLEKDNGPDVSVVDDVSYWGDRDMLGHVFKFMSLKGVRVEVRFADKPIRFSADVIHRKLAADEARGAIARIGGISV